VSPVLANGPSVSVTIRSLVAPSVAPAKDQAIDAGAVRPAGGGSDSDRCDHPRAGLLTGGDPLPRLASEMRQVDG